MERGGPVDLLANVKNKHVSMFLKRFFSSAFIKYLIVHSILNKLKITSVHHTILQAADFMIYLNYY